MTMNTDRDTEMSAQQQLESYGYTQELKRSVSTVDLLIYGLIFMVPIAPWAIFGTVYNEASGLGDPARLPIGADTALRLRSRIDGRHFSGHSTLALGTHLRGNQHHDQSDGHHLYQAHEPCVLGD